MATGGQFNLAVTRSNTSSLPASTTSVDIHQARLLFCPKRCRLIDYGRKALSHSLMNGMHDFEQRIFSRGGNCGVQPNLLVSHALLYYEITASGRTHDSHCILLCWRDN